MGSKFPMSGFGKSKLLNWELLTAEQFSAIVKQAQVLEQDAHGPKVYRLQNGRILKLFRMKRWWSWARFNPYSRRFWINSKKLQALDIPTVKVLSLHQLAQPQWTAVLYDPLPGFTLRDALPKLPSSAKDLIEQLGRFVSQLHDRGVYFRSLHLGNIVLTPAGEMGLIDIADLKIRKRRLSAHQRLRNLRHLCRLRKDRLQLGEAGWNIFCQAYFEASGTSINFSQTTYCKIKHLIETA